MEGRIQGARSDVRADTRCADGSAMVGQKPGGLSTRTWLLRSAWNLVVTPLPRGRQAIATLALFWLSVMLPDALSLEKLGLHLVFAGVVTCGFALASLPSQRLPAKIVRFLAHGAVAGLFVFLAGCAAVMSGGLAWTIPGWGRALIIAVSIVALATATPGWPGIRVPALLPLALFFALCLIGWAREEGVLRCDDFLRAGRQPGVEVVVPSAPEANACLPGEALVLGRYPRRVWEALDGGRFVVTTQATVDINGFDFLKGGRAVENRLTGVVCEVWRDPTRPPHCLQDAPERTVDYLGEQTGQAIIEAEGLDRLFVASYVQHRRVATTGLLSEFTRSQPLTLIAEHPMRYSVSEGYYDPQHDILGLFDQEQRQVDLVRASRFTGEDPIPLRTGIGESHYDRVHGEGIICLANGLLGMREGNPFLAVAYRGFPFSSRRLGSSSVPLAWASFAMGCDFDPETRRAYVGVATTGLLATIDYDSGEVLRWSFIGIGTRSMVLDRRGHRLYGVSYPDGNLREVDIDTGRTARQWFIGRYPRGVSLARDGQSILATSTLGVVRVRPDDRSD